MQYTLDNGSTWTAASFSGGSGANVRCQTTTATCANGTVLTIGMRATNAGGTTATGTITRTCDTVAPTAGASFTATAGAGECGLSWAAATDGASGMNLAEAYEIRYGASDPLTCDGGARMYIGADLSATHTRLSSGITYYYRLCYKDAVDNQSQFGSVRTCAPNPGAPVNTSGLTAYGDTATGAIPTFVAAGAVASNTTAITPALPAGIQVNDILLLFLETSNQAITIATANGGAWTEVAGSPQGTGTAVTSTATRLTVFWSRYNGTQGAPTTSDSGDHQVGRIIAVRGVVTSGNPWDVTAGGVDAAANTTGAIPGATTTVANTLVVTGIATALPDSTTTANFGTWTNAGLATLTERIDNTTANGDGGGLGIATGGRAATGAYGDTTVTLANSSVKAMMSIALKPDPPAPKVRRFSGGGFSTVESSANAPITTAITYVVNKSAPTRNEYMIGTIHTTNNNLAVQRGTYDSATAAWTWTNMFRPLPRRHSTATLTLLMNRHPGTP